MRNHPSQVGIELASKPGSKVTITALPPVFVCASGLWTCVSRDLDREASVDQEIRAAKRLRFGVESNSLVVSTSFSFMRRYIVGKVGICCCVGVKKGCYIDVGLL